MDIRELSRLLELSTAEGNKSISTGSQKSTEHSGSVDEARRAILAELVKTLKLTDVNKEIIESLARSFGRPTPVLPFQGTVPNESAILSEGIFQNVKEIEALLKSLVSTQSSTPQLRNSRLKESEARVLTEILKPIQAAIAALTNKEPLLGDTDQAPALGALSKFSTLLTDLQKTPSGHTTQEIAKFITAHIEHVRSSPTSATIAILDSKFTHILSPLIHTLHSIEARLQSDSEPSTKEFRQFIGELRANLQTQVESKAQDTEIRDTLEEAQLILKKEWQSLPQESPISKAVRKIQAQIESLLSMKDIDLQSGSGSLSPAELIKILPQVTAIRDAVIGLKELLTPQELGSDEFKKMLLLVDALTPESLTTLKKSSLGGILSQIDKHFADSHPSQESSEKTVREFKKVLQEVLKETSGLSILTEYTDIHAPQIALNNAAASTKGKIESLGILLSKLENGAALLSQASPLTMELIRNPAILTADPELLTKDKLQAIVHTLQADLQLMLHQVDSHNADEFPPAQKLPHAIRLISQTILATVELLKNGASAEVTHPVTPELVAAVQQTLTATLKDLKLVSDAQSPESSRTLKALQDLQLKLLDPKLSREEMKLSLERASQEILNQLESMPSDVATDEIKDLQRERKQIDRLITNQKPHAKIDSNLLRTPFDFKLTSELTTLKNMESMLQGQELIKKLNPIMNALGEPAFILFPTLIQGLLSRTEISFFSSDMPFEEAKKKKTGAGAGSYSCALIVLELPNMGKLGVHVAHRGEELLVNFTSEDTSVKEFIEPRLPKLSLALQALGFTSPKLSARSGEPASAAPDWIQDVAESCGIIA